MPANVKAATNFAIDARLERLKFQLIVTERGKRIGERIRQRREELGLKQRQLADRMPESVNNQRISDWERGVNVPSDRYIEALAVALERDIAYFYAEPPKETPDLMGALNGEQSQLDRIEAMLEEILGYMRGEPLDDEPATDGETGASVQPPGELGRDARGSAPKPKRRKPAG